MAQKKFSPMRYTAATQESAVQGALQIVGASREEIEVELLEQSERGVTVRIKPRSEEAPLVAAPSIPVFTEEIPSEEAPVADDSFAKVSVETFAASALFVDVAQSAPIAEDVPELLAQDEDEAEEYAPDAFDLSAATNAEFAGDLALVEEDGGATTLEFASEDETQSDEAELDGAQIEAAPEPMATGAPLDPELIERAQDKAQQFLDKMGLEASVQLGESADANTLALIIEGADVGILIGKHGATLQSFQYLLNLTLNAHGQGEGMRVVVDAGNYRARRQSSLEQIARAAASKARRDGRPVRLDPMPAHERRLVHMFLQSEADVITQSEGRDPMRRIVVAPGNNAPGTRSHRPLERGSERPSSDRPYGGRGMGGYGRRGDANSERRSRGR